VGWENVTPAPLPLPLPLFLPLSPSLFLFLSLSLSLSIALLDWRSTVSKIPRKILVSPWQPVPVVILYECKEIAERSYLWQRTTFQSAVTTPLTRCF